ncbi:hypothetical protein ON010_g17144 [Phytophthora cinnamomi]|nr:hypothetical protein ON010_g17144 [Phytophthora cinnamomi]
MDGAGGDSAADLFSRVLRGAEHESASEQSSSSAAAAVGGFLVCLDVPAATEFGVDYEVFRTGSKFQGVKFLPLGIHFVVFRSREQEHGIRQGFFVHVERHAQVIVREWSLEKEELGPPRPSLNVDNLERMAPDALSRWLGVEFGAILLPGDAVEDAATSTKAQEGVIPYFPDLPRTVRFTALQKTRADLSAEARTTYHFDRRLEELIQTDFGGDWKELIGELQLSFLVFLQLSSLAALEQWKQRELPGPVPAVAAGAARGRRRPAADADDSHVCYIISTFGAAPTEGVPPAPASRQSLRLGRGRRAAGAGRVRARRGARGRGKCKSKSPAILDQKIPCHLRSAATDDVAPLPTATELQARQQRQRDEEEAANAAIAAAFLRS